MEIHTVRDMDSFLDAVHGVAFDSHPKQLADRIGISQRALYRRLDENDSMPLRLTDFVGIFWNVDEAKQLRMLEPFLDYLGMTAIKRSEVGKVERGDVFASMLQAQQENGRLAALIQAAIADGVVDDQEAEQLIRQSTELKRQHDEMMGQLMAMRGVAPASVQ